MTQLSEPAVRSWSDALACAHPTTERDHLRTDRDLLERMIARTCGAGPATCAVERLFARFGDLGSILFADPVVLVRTADLSPAAIGDLHLLTALSVRLARVEASRRSVLSSWGAVVAYARAAIAHRPREQFRVLYLDRRNALLEDEWIADGSIDHAPVYPREVIRRALELSASALILMHNHPSGDLKPSQADIVMTRQVIEGARFFGLTVHDHLIVSREGAASFRTLGLL
jgi:DNA repair protein RadC